MGTQKSAEKATTKEKENLPLDTSLKCRFCEKIVKVSFIDSMKNGWPQCHNEGMHLFDTETDIQADLRKINNFSYRSFSHTRKVAKMK